MEGRDERGRGAAAVHGGRVSQDGRDRHPDVPADQGKVLSRVLPQLGDELQFM